MTYPEHQKYWFRVAGGSFALGLAMVGAAAAVGSTRPFTSTGGFMIAAYVAFAGAVVLSVCGLRQLRFPFAVIPTPPVKDEPVIVGRQPPAKKSYLPDAPTWADVDKAFENQPESRERQADL